MGVGDDVGKVSAGFHWGGRREGEEDGGHKRKKEKEKKRAISTQNMQSTQSV